MSSYYDYGQTKQCGISVSVTPHTPLYLTSQVAKHDSVVYGVLPPNKYFKDRYVY